MMTQTPPDQVTIKAKETDTDRIIRFMIVKALVFIALPAALAAIAVFFLL